MDILESLYQRKSQGGHLIEPAPSRQELDLILQAAVSVPDHGAIHPWRFVIIEGDGIPAFGEAILAAREAHEPGTAEGWMERLRDKVTAPMMIAVISSPQIRHLVPAWEQVISAGLAAFSIHLAANALGYASAWRSAAYRDGPLRTFFQMTEDEELLGWIQVGTLDPRFQTRGVRRRPDPYPLTQVVDGAAPPRPLPPLEVPDEAERDTA